MKYWIVPNNGQKFNMESAVRANNGFVDWRIKNVEIGDIVFMYKTMPDGCIKYMMEVVKTNLSEHDRLNQKSFWIDKASFVQGIGIYARFKLVEVLDEKVLSIRALRNHGIKGNVLTIKYGKDHKQIADGDILIYVSGGIMRYGERSLYDGSSILIPRKGSLKNIMFANKLF